MDNEELNARINAMHAEYGMTIAAMVKRSTEVAAELSSSAIRENALRVTVEKLETELKALKPVGPAAPGQPSGEIPS